MQLHSIDPSASALRQMTTEQLLHLGARHVVYLKAGLRNGELTSMLHGADGALLAAFDTIEDAVEIAAANGVYFATVH